MDDHGMGMAPCHRKLFEEILKDGRKVFQFLGWSLFQEPHLGITFKDFCPVRSCRDLSCKILARGMSVHVKAFGPERAFRNIVNLPLKGDTDRVTVFSV
jgi:hypothetical protein